MKNPRFLIGSTLVLAGMAALSTAGCESENVPLAKAPSTEAAPAPPATTKGDQGKGAPATKNMSQGDPTELTK